MCCTVFLAITTRSRVKIGGTADNGDGNGKPKVDIGQRMEQFGGTKLGGNKLGRSNAHNLN